MNRTAIVLTLLLLTTAASAQDMVRYRSRGPRGERPIQEAKGKIESESLAGVKIGGNLIAAGDIVDVEYETPGGIRIDLREAKHAEESRKTDEAIRKYRSLAASPVASNNSTFKRSFEYKVAMLTAAKSDVGSAELKAATSALSKWIDDHPDGWQRLQATRLLARLHLDADPPNVEAARKAYDDLAASKGIAGQVKTDCQLAIVELYLSQRNTAKAQELLGVMPTSDPRLPAYRIACGNESKQAKQLEDLLAKAEDNVKPTIYNLLGDSHRRDPAKQKEALFAYLWVDVVYNHDPVETAKAQDRIAAIFKKMGQDERAKLYRDKARDRE